jgi:hypothetical protein
VWKEKGGKGNKLISQTFSLKFLTLGSRALCSFGLVVASICFAMV